MLHICIAAAVLGIALVSFFFALPPQLLWITASFLALCFLLRYRTSCTWLNPVLCLLAGMLWSQALGLQRLNSLLPTALEQVPLAVEGTVVGLPDLVRRQGVPSSRFEFSVDRVLCGRQRQTCASGLRRIRLTWRQSHALQPGQRWRLQVRLKRPWGYMNPGGFDYQSWLVGRGIGATGYVQASEGNRLLGTDRWSLHLWRGKLAQRLDHMLADQAQAAVLKALLIADKRDLGRDQWRQFQHHGVVHLLVISGLHIGLVASLGFALARLLLLLTRWRHRATECAAVVAVLVALWYCLAAGASLPTRRALIATVVIMACIVRRREAGPGLALAASLLACLVVEPLAVMSASFWLSFGAVAMLMLGLAGRIGHPGYLGLLLRSQGVMALGMAPLMLASLGQLSWVAPVVNLLAVPLFSLAVIPVAMLGMLLLPLAPAIAVMCWKLSGYCLELLMTGLRWFEQLLPSIHSHFPSIPVPLLLAAGFAAVILVMPRGIPGKPLAAVTLLAMLFYRPAVPAAGDLWLTVLDVGQGLSVVVQVEDKTLVYDLGPRFEVDEGEAFSTAEAVVLPFLRSRGIAAVDALVLSHADNDHAGGWRELLAQIRVKRTLVGESIPGLPANHCFANEPWEWSGVRFRFLQAAPVGSMQGSNEALARVKSNNRSCVLQISVAGHRILLPGDIEQDIERTLVQQLGDQLAASVLVAPHHGSRSSSSWAFLKHVRPGHVVFSRGYHNAFNHPHAQVKQRYRQLGAELHDTSEQGAVEFRFEGGRMLRPTHYRLLQRRFWL